MIVYVESNFVLEIALGQEQGEPASHILARAKAGHIQLVIPTFGLSEPFSRIRQRDRDRRRLHQAMLPIERELRRTQHTQELSDALGPLGEAMLSIERTELDRLEATVAEVLDLADTVELNPETYKNALELRDEIDLEIEDSIVFSCVLADLKQRTPETPKCFVSKDAKAFFDPGVDARLGEWNCKYISKFPQAVDYINNLINSEG